MIRARLEELRLECDRRWPGGLLDYRSAGRDKRRGSQWA